MFEDCDFRFLDSKVSPLGGWETQVGGGGGISDFCILDSKVWHLMGGRGGGGRGGFQISGF